KCPAPVIPVQYVFFVTAPATTEISTLSLHDALPISCCDIPASASSVWHSSQPSLPSWRSSRSTSRATRARSTGSSSSRCTTSWRSEEHTSELQSQSNLVCRLLLETIQPSSVYFGGTD